MINSDTALLLVTRGCGLRATHLLCLLRCLWGLCWEGIVALFS